MKTTILVLVLVCAVGVSGWSAPKSDPAAGGRAAGGAKKVQGSTCEAEAALKPPAGDAAAKPEAKPEEKKPEARKPETNKAEEQKPEAKSPKKPAGEIVQVAKARIPEASGGKGYRVGEVLPLEAKLKFSGDFAGTLEALRFEGPKGRKFDLPLEQPMALSGKAGADTDVSVKVPVKEGSPPGPFQVSLLAKQTVEGGAPKELVLPTRRGVNLNPGMTSRKVMMQELKSQIGDRKFYDVEKRVTLFAQQKVALPVNLKKPMKGIGLVTGLGYGSEVKSGSPVLSVRVIADGVAPDQSPVFSLLKDVDTGEFRSRQEPTGKEGKMKVFYAYPLEGGKSQGYEYWWTREFAAPMTVKEIELENISKDSCWVSVLNVVILE